MTAAGGGGSLLLLCPKTGALLQAGMNSTDVGNALGVSSLSLFPSKFTGRTESLALAFGATVPTSGKRSSAKSNDTYAMLFTLRQQGSLPPILHWKCRLPEPQMTAGLLVSPCGNYLVGGGTTGTLYIWKSIAGNVTNSGGTLSAGTGTPLLNIVKAHYRSINVLKWSSCGRCLVTGGADGIVHCYSLQHLVQRNASDSASFTIQPIRSWSAHHLPITALVTLPGGRMVSASEDGRVILMELCSESVLATIQLPTAIRSMTTSRQCMTQRLYVGCELGSIHIIDLDKYAVHQTEQMGIRVTSSQQEQETNQQTLFDRVFGDTTSDEAKDTSSSPSFLTELKGHDRTVTSLSVVGEHEDDLLLVSGDEAGRIRIWDLQTRGCIHVIHPWSHGSDATPNESTTAGSKKSSSSVVLRPITSIIELPSTDRLFADPDSSSTGMFGSIGSNADNKKANHNRRGRTTSIVNLIQPLQKFLADDGTLFERTQLVLPLSFMRPKRNIRLWDTSLPPFDLKTVLAKRRKHTSSTTPGDDASSEVERLQKELEDAKSTIQRWEVVNKKLMSRLSQQPGQP